MKALNKNVEKLIEIAEQALELVDSYSGGESETAKHLEKQLIRVVKKIKK